MGSTAPRAFAASSSTSPDRVRPSRCFSWPSRSTKPASRRDRRAGGLSADQALHESGLRRGRVLNGNTNLKLADEPVLATSSPRSRQTLGRRMAGAVRQFGRNLPRIVLAPAARTDARLHRARFPGGPFSTQRTRLLAVVLIATGSVRVEVNPTDPSITVPIGEGSDLRRGWPDFPAAGAALHSARGRTRHRRRTVACRAQS